MPMDYFVYKNLGILGRDVNVHQKLTHAIVIFYCFHILRVLYRRLFYRIFLPDTIEYHLKLLNKEHLLSISSKLLFRVFI